jgi:hypothetical protein
MMSELDKPNIDQDQLVKEWQTTLPNTLNSTDQARIRADGANPLSLLVHIATAGHTGYTFDFKVTYIDSREISVELMDVEKDQVHVDERTEIIQNLIEDYVRHIHECAQVLHKVTHT